MEYTKAVKEEQKALQAKERSVIIIRITYSGVRCGVPERRAPRHAVHSSRDEREGGSGGGSRE